MIIADLLLAAGASRRFNGRKVLATCAGLTLLERAAEAGRQSACPVRLAVFGAVDTALVDLAARAEIAFTINERWAQGQGTSVAAGIAALPSGLDAVMIRTVDQVLIGRQALRTIIETALASPGHIVAARYGDTVGVPALFPRRCFAALMSLDGDRGARRIIADDADVIAVDLSDAAIDVDTRDDLAQAEAVLLSRGRAGGRGRGGSSVRS